MEVTHLFNENFYLISNYAVAGNLLFKEKSNCKLMEEGIDKYLNPICNIAGVSYRQDQYHIVLELKSREDFCKFYKEKYEDDTLREHEIPESTYIFSQQMANMQVSFVKQYNYLYNRKGALFGQRFMRELIETAEALGEHLKFIEKGEVIDMHTGEWDCKEQGYGEEKVMEGWGEMASNKFNLRGQIDLLPPKHLPRPSKLFLNRYFQSFVNAEMRV